MKIPPFQTDQYIQKIANEKIAGALIFGPEESVVISRFNFIAKKIVADLSDQFLVVNLSKERFNQDPSCLEDEFFSFSMFGGRKLITIKDIDNQAIQALKALLKKGEELKKSDNFILIKGADLDKSSSMRKICEESEYFSAIICYEDDDKTSKKLIEQQLRKNGVEISPNMVESLFQKLGKNRQIIASEIEKISLYLQNKKIDEDAINNVIFDQNEIKVEEFIENFVIKNYQKSYEGAKYLLENDFEAIMLIRFLLNYLLKLYFAKTAIESGKSSFDEAVKAQKLFFKIEKSFAKNLKNTNLKQIVFWLAEIQKLEIKIKTSSSLSPKLLFLNFIQEASRSLV